MDLGAVLIDDNDRQLAIRDPSILPQAARKLPAVFDRAADRLELQPGPVSFGTAILQVEIVSSHLRRCLLKFLKTKRQSVMDQIMQRKSAIEPDQTDQLPMSAGRTQAAAPAFVGG